MQNALTNITMDKPMTWLDNDERVGGGHADKLRPIITTGRKLYPVTCRTPRTTWGIEMINIKKTGKADNEV